MILRFVIIVINDFDFDFETKDPQQLWCLQGIYDLLS